MYLQTPLFSAGSILAENLCTTWDAVDPEYQPTPLSESIKEPDLTSPRSFERSSTDMLHRPVRVLIIDADPTDREATRNLISESGDRRFDFRETDRADDGWQLAQSFQPDCILCEYRLPDKTGLDFLRQFPMKPGGLPCAFIMLTNKGDETIAVRAMKAGAHDYLSKSRLNEVSLPQIVHNAIVRANYQQQWAERQARLERAATIDELTGLYNRRCFEERIINEFERARRYGIRSSLLMLDLDWFKTINDQYGHLAGDKVLTEFGRILTQCSRSSDLPARYGGEEFCLFLANTDISGARVLAERIRSLTAETVVLSPSGDEIRFTCSIGVAEFDNTLTGPEDLIARADDALYAAKNAGRNRVSVYRSMSTMVS